jgi:hypothetical protein
MSSRRIVLRAELLGSFVLGVVALAPACAQGTLDPTIDLLPAATDDTSECFGCPADHVCSRGECVPETADNDGDGHIAKYDCDDRDPSIYPGAKEICNGRDDDCDGKIDEDFDEDRDGWVSCTIGNKRADCDDHDPTVNPGAVEVCNGKDDDCDGEIDEGFDKDGDGFYSCAREGRAADCDDGDAKVNPAASEVCNGKDDDCDGKIDELPAMLSGLLVPPIDPHWALAGSATFDGGWVQLTPEQTYASGALFWNATYTFDTFEGFGTFWMSAKSDCADGIAFVWVPGSDITAIGASGYGYGVLSLGGYAVVVDNFSNPNEPPAPFLVVLDAATNTHLHRAAIPEVRDGKAHDLRVKLDAGKVSVWLDYVNYVHEFPIPGYVPFAGHWGFTAATGARTCVHRVRDVSMSFPNGQGCVP